MRVRLKLLANLIIPIQILASACHSCQGDLGTFGASELSDVTGFVELPDGKVGSHRRRKIYSKPSKNLRDAAVLLSHNIDLGIKWGTESQVATCVKWSSLRPSCLLAQVVTGSQYGKLLLWEGVFVKAASMLGSAMTAITPSGCCSSLKTTRKQALLLDNIGANFIAVRVFLQMLRSFCIQPS
eukprot:3308360-Amphidinium_carterae.1